MTRVAAARASSPKQHTVKERIHTPQQERSQKTMQRILDAFERLLDARPYEAITIAEVTVKSKTGAGSLYARFRDKRSILLALHERVRDRALDYFEEIYAPSQWANESLQDALERTMRGSLRWYREHHNVIKAALLLNDHHIYERIHSSFHPGMRQLSLLLKDKVPGLSRVRAAIAATMIFRLKTALFQQITIFDGTRVMQDELSDDELVTGLVGAALAQVCAPA